MQIEVFDYLIKKNDSFPNNEKLSLLLYKNAFSKKVSPNVIEATELPITTKQILKVPLPNTDPILGKDGPLFKYWQ